MIDTYVTKCARCGRKGQCRLVDSRYHCLPCAESLEASRLVCSACGQAGLNCTCFD